MSGVLEAVTLKQLMDAMPGLRLALQIVTDVRAQIFEDWPDDQQDLVRLEVISMTLTELIDMPEVAEAVCRMFSDVQEAFAAPPADEAAPSRDEAAAALDANTAAHAAANGFDRGHCAPPPDPGAD